MESCDLLVSSIVDHSSSMRSSLFLSGLVNWNLPLGIWNLAVIGTYWGPAATLSHRISMGGSNTKRPEDTESEEIPLRRQDSYGNP